MNLAELRDTIVIVIATVGSAVLTYDKLKVVMAPLTQQFKGWVNRSLSQRVELLEDTHVVIADHVEHRLDVFEDIQRIRSEK